MFQEITKIPTSENVEEYLASSAEAELCDLMSKLRLIFKDNHVSTYMARRTALNVFLELMGYIDAMHLDDIYKDIFAVNYRANSGNMEYIFKDSSYENALGIVINRGTSTSYEEIEWTNQTILEGASETLRQTPRHFLKIFHRNDNPNLLFVWTNQDIKPETLYKLKELQNAINKKEIKSFCDITEKIYKAFSNNDIKAINQALTEFFQSPIIERKRHQEFIQTFTSTNKNQISRLKYKIKNAYDTIKSYENQIAKLGTQINEYNKQLLLIRDPESMTEDIETLFKYLTKHPYIKGFDADSSRGDIILHFRSPLIYYTEFAIEKIRKNYAEKSDQKIFDLFMKKRFQLMTECSIAFEPNDFTVSTTRKTARDPEFMGHPHIDEYGCFGNHREAIYEAAETRDYIGAIEQISQATLNINFYDACIVDYIMRYFRRNVNYSGKHTWYDTVTGELVTLEEAIRRSEEDETT